MEWSVFCMIAIANSRAITVMLHVFLLCCAFTSMLLVMFERLIHGNCLPRYSLHRC